MNFSQTITLRTARPEKLLELIAAWDRDQATTDIMGYMGSRVLADRVDVGTYVVVVDFGVIDPDVPAAEEAARNNDRPETQAFGAALAEIVESPPEFHDYDELYRTDQ